MFEQVREMTTFSFLNNHIGCTAGVGKIPRSSGAGEESGWEMGVGELWVKDGVEGEKNSSRTAAQAPPPRTEGLSLLSKFPRTSRMLVKLTPPRRWEEAPGRLLGALQALWVCVYKATSEHSVARETENTDGK